MQINLRACCQVFFLTLLIIFFFSLVGENAVSLARAQETCDENIGCADLPAYCDGDQTRKCRGGYCDNGQCIRSCDAVISNPLNCGSYESPVNRLPTSENPEKDGLCKNFDPSWIYCTKDQADKGIVVNNEGYMKSGVCHRKIYKYEGKAGYISEEDNCCSTPLTPVADQAECKIDAEKTNSSNSSADLNGNNSSQTQEILNSNEVCRQAQSTYLNTKVATRLALYHAILKGVTETCVKADLGLDLQLTAENEDGKTGRLLLCSGADSKPDNLVLKWRVDTGEGNPPEPAAQEFSKEIDNLPNKEHVKKAEELLAI